jgi:hypothetical protein
MEVLSLDKKEECFSIEGGKGFTFKKKVSFMSSLASQIGFQIMSLNNCKPN